MSELLLVTGVLEPSSEVLPALGLLLHSVRVLPADASALVEAPPADLVLVDARRDLAHAKSICRLLHTTGLDCPMLAIVTEGGLAAISAEWNADDVILNTAGPAEVEARLRLATGRRALRAAADAPDEIRSGDLAIDEATYSARLRGRVLDLTFKEFELLKFLAQHPGRVFTRAHLLQEVWGYDYFGGTRTVDVHVRRLRAKLGAEHEALIGTVRNVGYRFVPVKGSPEDRDSTDLLAPDTVMPAEPVTWPSPPGTTLNEGPLSPELASQVQELSEAAAKADGVTPLSEDALLQVRHGSSAGARDLTLRTAGGTLAGYAHLDAPGAAEPDTDASGELVVHPAFRRRGHGTALVAALLAGPSGTGVRIWAHGELPGAVGLAQAAGFTRVRALWQMRMPLTAVPGEDPVVPPGITIRTFRPGADEESWLAVNHRAFAHHPEQGGWTLSDLRLREAEAWFDPAGFFLAERDGQLAGFHWTKVHQDGGENGAPIGEVYVVGVDPGRQGGGLGRTLTLAGLGYLRRLGLADVLLYVDEDNTAAVRMYTALGFRRWSTDAMYRKAAA